MAFYNTTCETGQLLIAFTNKEKTQTETILDMFRDGSVLNSESIFDSLNNKGNMMLLTSIRRSLSDLCKTGHIVHVGKTRGKFGVQIFNYKLK